MITVADYDPAWPGRFQTLREEYLRALAWLFPALMTLVVIGTGAQYVLDVLSTALLLATSILATSAWRRLRADRHHHPT